MIAGEVMDELARLALVATMLYAESVDVQPEQGLADLFAKVESLRRMGPR